MVRHFPGALAAPGCQEKAEGALSYSQFPPPCISVVEPCRILCSGLTPGSQWWLLCLELLPNCGKAGKPSPGKGFSHVHSTQSSVGP